MNWLYLFIASLFQICWIYSLKYLDWVKVKDISLIFSNPTHLLPLLGYVLFGIGNVVFYSMAMKTISPSTAFAVWTGMALVGTKIFDVVLFKDSYNTGQIVFICVIIIGILGLKYTSTN